MIRGAIFLLLTAFLASCAQYENRRGVEVTWDPSNLKDVKIGETTRDEILDRLGPPSQLIALDGETVLYYLFSHSQGKGIILLVYNRFEIDTRYDRAVFIFDADDRLTEYSTYIHEPG